MNIRIDGSRIRTTSPYDLRVIRALNKLEGMKKWHANKVLSFDNSTYNLEVWRAVFPSSVIEGAEAPIAEPSVVEDWGSSTALVRPRFEFVNQPLAHQAKAIAKLAKKAVAGLFMDVGTGKSFVGATFAGMRWCLGLSDHLIIVAPNDIQIQWVEDENAPFKNHLSKKIPWCAWVFRKGKRQKELYVKMLEFDGIKILSINIDAVDTPAAEKVMLDFIRRSNGNCSIYWDESHDGKNDASKRTQAMYRFGNLCKYKLIMTGSPLTKDIVDNYSQFKFLNPAIIGHKFVTTFKNYYCEYQKGDYGPVLTGYRNLEELYRRIDPFIYRITADEALDLPPRMYIPERFSLTDRQYELMQEFKDQFFAECGDDRTVFVKNSASLLTKLQQISCGFISDPQEKDIIPLDDNPRLDRLLRLLDQRSDKVVVWCRYQYDVEIITKALGERSVAYYGPTKRPDRYRNKMDFIHDPNCDRFVATAATGGTGTDGLQDVSSTAIYYSNSFNAKDRWQSEGRTRRYGTKESQTYFDLIARRSPDAGILANLKKKKDISTLFYDDYRKLLEMEAEMSLVDNE